jgi:hypothetical protein
MAIIRKLFLITLGIAGLLTVTAILSWKCLAVRFGTPAMRQTVLAEWVNQRSPLTSGQKQTVVYLLSGNVGDADAPGEALSVLSAHLKEDESGRIGYLLSAIFNGRNPSDKTVALSGLLNVSTNFESVAEATFRYYLKHCENINGANALNASVCISGLKKYSCVEALPDIERFTNSSTRYVAEAAREAVAQLAQKADERRPTNAGQSPK